MFKTAQLRNSKKKKKKTTPKKNTQRKKANKKMWGVYDLTLYTYDCDTGVGTPQQFTGTSYFQCCDNSAGDGSCFANNFAVDRDNWL